MNLSGEAPHKNAVFTAPGANTCVNTVTSSSYSITSRNGELLYDPVVRLINDESNKTSGA